MVLLISASRCGDGGCSGYSTTFRLLRGGGGTWVHVKASESTQLWRSTETVELCGSPCGSWVKRPFEQDRHGRSVIRRRLCLSFVIKPSKALRARAWGAQEHADLVFASVCEIYTFIIRSFTIDSRFEHFKVDSPRRHSCGSVRLPVRTYTAAPISSR